MLVSPLLGDHILPIKQNNKQPNISNGRLLVRFDFHTTSLPNLLKSNIPFHNQDVLYVSLRLKAESYSTYVRNGL